MRGSSKFPVSDGGELKVWHLRHGTSIMIVRCKMRQMVPCMKKEATDRTMMSYVTVY